MTALIKQRKAEGDTTTIGIYLLRLIPLGVRAIIKKRE